jgi:hypothetical protein
MVAAEFAQNAWCLEAVRPRGDCLARVTQKHTFNQKAFEDYPSNICIVPG